MDKGKARELLVGARNALDHAAKKIVDDYDSHEEARALAAEDARGKIVKEFVEVVWTSYERCLAAFEQWEITESRPLNEDELFMYALRDFLRDIEGFGRSVSGS